MACSNCYNGCSEIVADKCVKYTGADISSLDISNGDTLNSVIIALGAFLSSVITGNGIIIDLDDEDYCELVSQYLPDSDTITALDLFSALTQAACNIQEQINTINNTLSELNSEYTINCLSGITDNTNTHEVLQVVINELCALQDTIAAIASDLETNYVRLSEFDTLVEEYLENHPTSNLAKDKMIPYTVVEYYGSLSNYPETGDSFDVTGAGQNYWEDVYLCNGLNGTPDKRGRSPIGVISGVGGGALDTEVNPASNPTFNKDYTISGANSKNGVNSITLVANQMPTHTHTATVTDPGHATEIVVYPADDNEWTQSGGSGRPVVGIEDKVYNATSGPETATTTNLAETGISVSNANAGGDQPHSNVHPVLACYYIMYIPS